MANPSTSGVMGGVGNSSSMMSTSMMSSSSSMQGNDNKHNNSETNNVQTFVLEAESELRLEVPHSAVASSSSNDGGNIASSSASSSASSFSSFSSSRSSGVCSVRLVPGTGSAELFGAELAPNRWYPLTGAKVAVLTWHGCTLEVAGVRGIAYASSETDTNVSYVNTHAQLEAARDAAVASGGASGGPRVLLAGPADSGKTSLAKVLSAYAVRLGRRPIHVDLDPSQSVLAPPGVLAASPATPETATPTSHASPLLDGTTPLDLWYGSTDPRSHPDLYEALLRRLGENVDDRLRNDPDADASGVVINTCGWIEDGGYRLLLSAVEAFRVDVVLVLGHDRLYSMLTTEYGTVADQASNNNNNNNNNSAVRPKIIKLPRSGGVVSRDAAFRRVSRNQAIKKYFHGDLVKSNNPVAAGAISSVGSVPDGGVSAGAANLAAPPLSVASQQQQQQQQQHCYVHRYQPFLVELPLDRIRLFKLSSVSLAASMLPVNAARQETDPVQLEAVHDVSPRLRHYLLAVCHPDAVAAWEATGRAADLYLAGVAGLVAVERVDPDRERIGLLAPASGDLPSDVLLMGDVTWMD